jgi:hypothetical protein
MRHTTNLSKAFRTLRKEGYVAKQNFMCCQSCAWAELSEKEAEKVVFYHNQDYRDLKRGDDLYLAWAGNGNYIAETLIKFGMHIDWDGTPNTRIVVRNSSII